MFKVNGGAVSWKETVVDSTTEAKYIAASEAAKEGVWIRKFLIELDVFLMPLACWISTVTIVELLRKPRSQGITRRANTLCGDFISFESSSNISDPLTKPLPQPKHERHTRAMGIRYILD